VPVRELRAHEPDALEAAGWSELLDEAASGEITFAGGALRMTPTPAMCLFDVDGAGDPAPLALAGARAACAAIRRHRIGGSIGIDLPTVGSKAERVAIGEAIDATLPPPFERTAMNGFGFVQIVRPRPRASIPELVRADPVGAAARATLRMIERVPPNAPNRHRLPAAVAERIAAQPGWMAELVRRTGRTPILEA
jgi:ribonuclease G